MKCTTHILSEVGARKQREREMYSAQVFAERNGFQYTETKRSETGRRLGQQRRGEKNFAYLSFTTVRLRDRFVYNKKIDRADLLVEGHVRLEEKGMMLYETYCKSTGIGLYSDAGDVEHEFRHVDRYCQPE